MNSYISAFKPWAICLAIVAVIESAYWLTARPTLLDRSNFRPYGVQELFMLSPKRSYTFEKLRLDLTNARVVFAGDSSGMFSLIPDVINRHMSYGRAVNLSCCAPQGWHGYLAVLEYALREAPSIEFAVLYITPENFISEKKWRDGPRRVGKAEKNFLMGAYIERDIVSFWRYFALPTMALRRDVIQTVFYRGRVTPRDHMNPKKAQSVYQISQRDGYQTEADPTTKLKSGIFSPKVDMTFDWGTLKERSLLEIAVSEFIEIAEAHGATPVLAWAPSPRAEGAGSERAQNEVERVKKLYPQLKVPFPLPETYPPNFFGGPSHIQRTFAIDVSNRFGRAMAEIAGDIPVADTQIDIEGAAIENNTGGTLNISSAIRRNECVGDTDFTGSVLAACNGQRDCTVDLSRILELTDATIIKKQKTEDGRKISCRPHDYVEFWCGEGPVRTIRQTVSKKTSAFGLTCKPLEKWDDGSMPRGIQIRTAYVSDSCVDDTQDAYAVVAGLCDGTDSCSVETANIPLLNAPKGACQPALDIQWRCDNEKAVRSMKLIDDFPLGASGIISCLD